MSLDALPRTCAVLRSGIDAGLHPGAQLYVSLDGRPIVDDALGDARPGVTMTRDTSTLWMSAGKPLTAVAALQLVDRGMIALDTRVAEVIPEFAANGKAAVTLRHVLTHTAGFRGPLNNFTPGTWDEILARVYALKQEPGWVPGERAGYHIGSSWFVLGALVRRLDGRPIDAYVRASIFAPLGEPDASIGMTADAFDRGEHAIMFVTEKSPAMGEWPGNSRDANQLPRPGANARGPIRALGRLYERLLSPAAVRALPPSPGIPGEGRGEGCSGGERRTHAEDPHPNPLPEYQERGLELLPTALACAMTARQRIAMLDQTFKQTLDWGLGVMIDSKQYAGEGRASTGEHQYGFGPHASPDTFGHSGNQSSCAYADPGHRLVVAWTCNGMPGEARHQQRASAINRAIYEDLGLARPE